MSSKSRGKKIGFQRRTTRRTRQRNRRLVAEALEPRVMLSSTPPMPLESSQAMASTSVASDTEFNYVLGGLFPQLPNGQPNVITSDSLRYDQQSGAYVAREGGQRGILETHLRVTTEPVTIEGTHGFLNDWLIPQLTTKDNQESIFSKFFSKSVEPDKAGNNSLKWTSVPRNHSIQNLIKIGYKGPGYENGATNTPFWNAIGTVPGATIPGTQANLYDEVTNLDNYDPASLWANYDGTTDTIFSNFDTDALRENIQTLLDPAANPDPDLWYPSIYYTFQKQAVEGGNFNGPVLIVQPGDDVKLHFTNDIQIGDLSPEELELATLIRNSTNGNTASDGLGGTTTVNYHLHGSHTNPAGFGDNVVARYTAGQEWTTNIEILPDHGQGAYWYHAHYHPSVNQQVYGGLSGFMQIGDPLSKVPDFAEVPRNLAVIKITQIGTEAGGEKLTLTGYDNLGLNVVRGTMMTVNGEFQPEADGGEGGWQALTLSNQTNDQQFQISLIHTDEEQNAKTLPIFQYGEDGHQLPQIRQVRGVLGQNSDGKATAAWPTSYSRTENLISLPPGKRVDLLFFLPKGKTEIASTYAFEAMNPDSGAEETYTVRNAGFYPDFTNANTGDGNIFASGFTSTGPLATFTVTNDIEAPVLEDQIAAIDAANEGIQVQPILPTTRPEEYDLAAIPSINLFATDDGEEIWDPIRQRNFNWSRTLVGPESEWDAATKAAIATYEEATGVEFERYHNLPLRGGESPLADWLGYANPWLINDHAFPNGNLTIAQLGTIEEWQLNNWSVSRIAAPVPTTPFQYIGHPFHIHINDFQVKNSDTELDHKGNLQDVVMLNSSGYHAYDANYKTNSSTTPANGDGLITSFTINLPVPEAELNSAVVTVGGTTQKSGTYTINGVGNMVDFNDPPANGEAVLVSYTTPEVRQLDPLRGEFISIDPALDQDAVDKLGTWGANSQTIRMVFQDYVGTYVYHCHILPHEDAGMMQVITVIENTDSSWLAPSEDFDFKVRRNKHGFLQSFDVFLAQDYEPYRVNLQTGFGQEMLKRVAFGDITRGFTQDLLVSSSGSGIVRVIDGDELLRQGPGKRSAKTEVLSEIRPYAFSDLAPYAFAEDFTGDNRRDLVTAGYRSNDGDSISLHDLTMKGWLGSADGRHWDEAMAFRPFDPDFPGYVATTGKVSGSGMQDGANNDHTSSAGTSHGSHDSDGSMPTPTAGGSVGEYGTVSVNHDWTTVELGATYQHPIVVVSDPAFKGRQPATVRLRNVESESFQLKLQEPSYLNGRHVYERLSYVVMEMGDWELADGTRISAGHTDTDRLTSEGFETVSLNGFESTPTVLTQTLTSNENDWVTTRVRQQDRDGFQLALQEEERLNQSHQTEHVGWIAIAQGSTTDGDNRLEAFTTEANFSKRSGKIQFAQSFSDNRPPAVIAKLGSTEDTDPATLRLLKVDEEGFRVRVQEERSRDRETRHGREAVSYLALEGNSGTIEAMPSDGNSSSPPEKLFPISPVSGLTADQTSITMGDFNLDNFNDYAIAYATNEGIRVTIFDGAAVSLQYSTGQFEGGYFPRESLLVDAVVIDAALENLDSLVLNAGFNSFYQSPIENLVATVKTSDQTVQQLTFQLNAGHFIATSEPGSPDGTGSGTSAHGGHGGMSSFAHDDKVINLIHESSTPLHLADVALLTGDDVVSTPVFTSVLGIGGLVIEDQLLIAQGSADNGASSTSDDLFNTAQQLVIDLEGLRKIDRDDFAGVRQANFTPGEVTERNNLANLTYETYFGRLPDPSGAAKAAASLSEVDSISDYLHKFLDNPGAQQEVHAHFGSSLEEAEVAHIVETTIETLYARGAKRKEIKRWTKKVNKGLSKTMLPMAILQNTHGKDRRRVEFLSAASQFSNAQWANDAILLGSFGQGYADNLDRFEILNQIVQETGRIKKRAKAQQQFDAFMNKTVELIAGSKVSKAGFF
jgi:FtsP/CotA-like multicopper oxidase with cupredoxin domain